MSDSEIDPTGIGEAEPIDTWHACREALDSFPLERSRVRVHYPCVAGDQYAEAEELEPLPQWIFRGEKSSRYILEPGIERMAKRLGREFRDVEHQVETEFRRRAVLHTRGMEVPPADRRDAWLAFMQHHGAPTRLLDFTLSPYVALFFAVNDSPSAAGGEETTSGGEDRAVVWAIDAWAVIDKATDRLEAAIKKNQPKPEFRPVSLAPPFDSAGDVARKKGERLDKLSQLALSRDRNIEDAVWDLQCAMVLREVFPTPRLERQQGVFVYSVSRKRLLDSLLGMMTGRHGWCRRFAINPRLATEIELNLHKMNIHHLSLFPDLFGLAQHSSRVAALHFSPPPGPPIEY